MVGLDSIHCGGHRAAQHVGPHRGACPAHGVTADGHTGLGRGNGLRRACSWRACSRGPHDLVCLQAHVRGPCLPLAYLLLTSSSFQPRAGHRWCAPTVSAVAAALPRWRPYALPTLTLSWRVRPGVRPCGLSLAQVITSAEFHPTACHTFAFASSKGCIRMCDLRASALVDKPARTFEEARAPIAPAHRAPMPRFTT